LRDGHALSLPSLNGLMGEMVSANWLAVIGAACRERLNCYPITSAAGIHRIANRFWSFMVFSAEQYCFRI